MIRFKRGDTSIPAKFLNDVARVIELPQNRQRGREATLPEGIVYIKNTSGTNLDRFSVLGISDVAITPADNPSSFASQPVLVGIAPTSGTLTTYAVLRNPIANNAIGEAFISGMFAAIINVVDEAHSFACPTVSGTYLSSCPYGQSRIYWKEAGTGEKWAVLMLNHCVGKYGTPHDATSIASDTESEQSTGSPNYTSGSSTVLWDSANVPSGTNGYVCRVINRVVYKPDGDMILYQFSNVHHYDSSGRLILVEPEIRESIATPEACEEGS